MVALVMPNDLHKLLGGGRELKAKARGITARHDGCARGGARGIARVTGVEIGALLGQAVDVRCWHAAVGQAAAIQADVVVAQVVGHNEDDVGWFGTHGCLDSIAIGLGNGPSDLPVGLVFLAQEDFDGPK